MLWRAALRCSAGARLHHGQRQGRRAAHGQARALALGDARLCAVRRALAVFMPMIVLIAGGVREGLGAGLLARQPHDLQNFTFILFEQPGAITRSSTASSMRAITAFAAIALALAIAYVVRRASWRLGATCSPSCAWRRSSSPASCWRSASMRPTRRRRLRSTAPSPILDPRVSRRASADRLHVERGRHASDPSSRWKRRCASSAAGG